MEVANLCVQRRNDESRGEDRVIEVIERDVTIILDVGT